MKLFLAFFMLLSLTELSCQKSSSAEFEYIKVLTVHQVSQITPFNKGYKLDDYFLFDAMNERAKLRVSEWSYLDFNDYYPADPDTTIYYQGSFENAPYVDTLNMLIKVLKRDKDGPISIPESLEGSTYCGPTFFTEFKDHSGIHFHEISMHNNDTLHMFEKFFYRLRDRSNWSPKVVSGSFLNDSVEMVRVLTGSGFYQQLPTPFIPPKCDSSVDFTTLYGKWRTVGDRHTGIYWLISISGSGNWFIDKMYTDSSRRIYDGKIISTNSKDQFIRLRSKGGVAKLEFVILNSTCMKFRVNPEGRLNEYYRVN